MLDLSAVDLADLVVALEDHSYDCSWWIDAVTGEIWMWSPDDSDPELDPEARNHVRQIWPLESRIAYGDMEDFIASVPDRRAADLLDRDCGPGRLPALQRHPVRVPGAPRAVVPLQ